MAGAAGVIGVRRGEYGWLSLLEGISVFTAILLYIWWLREDYPRFWMAILAFIFASHILHGEGPSELGFRWREFRASIAEIAPWLVNLGMALWGLGVLLDTVRASTPRYVGAGLLAYIVWGTVQQYLLNSYFVNRLTYFTGDPRSGLIPVAAAALFAGAHTPNWFLMGVTGVAGYFCAKLFLRHRSVFSLGLAHGILGFLIQMCVPDSIVVHMIVGPRYWFQH